MQMLPLSSTSASCRDCLVDTILTRWVAVKHQRLARVGQDMAAAANEISERPPPGSS